MLAQASYLSIKSATLFFKHAHAHVYDLYQNVDINQLTGTCVGGSPCASPISHINLDVTSNDAVIQINQKDSANDS